MLRREKVGDIEIQEVDLQGVDKILELARLAKDSPDDLREALVETIQFINKPMIFIKEGK